MAHKLLTDIEVQGEGLFNGNLTLGTASTFSKLVFDTAGFDIGEIEVGSFQAMLVDAQDGTFSLMSNSSSQNHAIEGTMGGYVSLNYNGNKKLQTASTGINITGLLYVSGDARVVGAFRDTSDSPGTSGQVLSSTATGTSWIDQSTITANNAEHVVIYAKNTSGASISKGTPVYITGTVGATDTVEIAPADASNSAKMPAVGLLDDTLANNAFGYVITGGFMDNITTDPIDGATPSSNDTVYVKSGGGLTLTKPTGSNLIQNVAKVGKVSGGNSGSLIVSSILRTNDVPNLTTRKIWVGSAANTIESATVHLDETNGRMGIGTASPQEKLDISAGSIRLDDNQRISWSSNDSNIGRVRIIGNEQNDFISFATDNSEKMRLTNTGLGIGTTSPSDKLTVEDGNIRLNSTSSYPAQGLYAYWNNGSPNMGGISWHSNPGFIGSEWNHYKQSSPYTQSRIRLIGDANGGMYVNLNNSDVFTILASNGNVGIGTTAPGAKLDVFNSGTAINARSSQGTGLIIQGGANSQDIAQFKNQMGSITNVIDTNGYVGIGETNPDTDLHIKNIGSPKIKLETTQSQYATPGTIEAWNGATNTQHGYLTWATNPGITGCRLAFSNAGNTSWLEIGSNYVRNTIGGSVKSHLNATGLGINNTNPQEELDVTGTIKGDEYKGYLPAFQHGGFYHSSSASSSSIYWIPTNYISETTSSQYYNNWVAPYNGRVKKIIMRYASGTTPTATSVTFRKSINGSFDLSTYPATIAGAASTSMTAVKEFGSTDITFNEGDRVQIGFTTNGGTRLLYGFAYTIVLEYDKD